MSGELDPIRVSRDCDSTSGRKPVDFHEAPGEVEADDARATFLAGSRRDMPGLASQLSRMDSATRARVVSRLQQERGNAYVQRFANYASCYQDLPGQRIRVHVVVRDLVGFSIERAARYLDLSFKGRHGIGLKEAEKGS